MVEDQRLGGSALFWAVALLSLLWNGFGTYDFLMVAIRDPDTIARYSSAAVRVLDALPPSIVAAWGLGVGAALAGSLLLLLRSRLAVYAFGASLLGLAASTFYQLGADVPEEARTIGLDVMSLIVWSVAVLLLVGSIRWQKRGVLR